jgi:hypothetical protein
MIQFATSDERSAFSERRLVDWPRLGAAAILAACLAGCSMSIPLPSFMSGDATGSIKSRPAPFADDLDDADWRIAEPTLAEALKSGVHDDPKQWSNPASGHGGAFQPVAGAFKREGQTCRAFLARINTAADQSKTMQAVGCVMAGGAVFVDQAQPWKAL